MKKEEPNMYKELKKLINRWNETAKKEWAVKDEMSDMYIQDAKDAMHVLHCLHNNLIDVASNAIAKLDTAPREAIVMAIYADTSSDFVSQLGWEVSPNPCEIS